MIGGRARARDTLVVRLHTASQRSLYAGGCIAQSRFAFTMAAFNVLVQWYGFIPNASGFAPLSIAEFDL